MSANRQWKVVDERYSGNVFTDDHWYSTHIPRIVRVRTTQTTQKIRKTAQYCANFYAKPSFELLKTCNRVKHRYGEHRRTTAEVPRQKNWWNAQIADVSRKTRNLCVIRAFTRILGSVTGPFANNSTFTEDSPSRHVSMNRFHAVCRLRVNLLNASLAVDMNSVEMSLNRSSSGWWRQLVSCR